MEPLDRIRISLASSSKQEREVIDLLHRHPGINGPREKARCTARNALRNIEHLTLPLASTP
jgi:hypothetical protein